MTQQKWKTDPSLYDAPTKTEGNQVKKELDYATTYRTEFLESDPLKDWESIERCIWLWKWCMEKINDEVNFVLDVGTKDAQFPKWLTNQGLDCIGLEYSKSYVKYAQGLGRPSVYGNACDMEFYNNTFDFVFSHHVHGLLPDYMKGLQEMYRVTKKYMVALNQIPGNPRKHYSYVDSPQIFYDFIQNVDCEVIYNDYLDTGLSNEWVIFLKKEV